jgi:hypothetical protein
LESNERMTIAERLWRKPDEAPRKSTHPLGARLMMTRLVILESVASTPMVVSCTFSQRLSRGMAKKMERPEMRTTWREMQ